MPVFLAGKQNNNLKMEEKISSMDFQLWIGGEDAFALDELLRDFYSRKPKHRDCIMSGKFLIIRLEDEDYICEIKGMRPAQ
ncbi:MAG: hypothetical protein ACTSU6_06750 [Candidatus Njordarchaeales archaeon]